MNIDLVAESIEQIKKEYEKKARQELEKQFPEMLEQESNPILKKLLSYEEVKKRFIEILTEETLKEIFKTKATLKYKGGSENYK